MQARVIPVLLRGCHCVVASHTGSGKTLAFLLPLVQRLRDAEAATGLRVRPGRPRAVVVSPTRELAAQTLRVAKSLCHHARFSSALLSGAEARQLQRATLATPRDVVVGTPGRLRDLLVEGAWRAGDVRCLVVDEADTLIDAGFGEEVEALMTPVLACGGQVVLVTATLTPGVDALVAACIPSAQRCVTASLHRAVAGARHRFVALAGDADKMEALRALMARPEGRTLVFANTVPSCRAAEHALAEAGCASVAYHGGMSGEGRAASLAAFAGPDPPVMVATDLAARGLDFECGVDHVVMFDFPLNPTDFLHRTGRTARAGRSGRVTALVAKRDAVLATQIEEAIRRGAPLDGLSSSRAVVAQEKVAEAALRRGAAPPKRFAYGAKARGPAASGRVGARPFARRTMGSKLGAGRSKTSRPRA